MVKTADVVPNTQIITSWGNEVRDRSLQIVASVSELNSSFPGPVKGQAVYVASGDVNEGLFIWDGAAWRPPWNTAWGMQGNPAITNANSGNVGSSYVAMLTTGFTPVVGRRYKATCEMLIAPSASSNIVARCQIRDQSNNVLNSGDTFISINAAQQTLIVHALFTPATPTALTLTAWLASIGGAGGNIYVIGAANQINSYLFTEDIGPAGAPT